MELVQSETKKGTPGKDAQMTHQEWVQKPLAEIVDKNAPICYGLVQVGPHDSNGVPVLAIKDLTADFKLNFHYSSVERERDYKRSRVKFGDILISVKGSMGKIGVVPAQFVGNISRDLARIRLSEQVYSDYCFHMLQSDFMQKRIAKKTVGTTRFELSIATLRQITIPLPPTLHEQQAIAEALSDMDAMIRSLERLIEKKKAIKQGAMQELLRPKERWVERFVESFCSIRTGDKDTQNRIETGKYPFFVRSNKIERIDSYSFDGPGVITSGDGVGVGKIFHLVNGKFDYHQRVYLMHNFSNTVDITYFYYYFSEYFFDRVMAMTAKSSVDSVRRDMIAEMDIPMPPSVGGQKSIGKTIQSMDIELGLLEQKLTKTRHLKQGMMQDLLTGRKRLV